MDLFTSLLVKAISGILYVIYWIAFHLIRIAWYLSLYLLMSLGVGALWLARGGHGRPVDDGRFGRYLEDEALWQDDATGAVYPVTSGPLERCEIQAEEAGTYWRRTALARLMRMGAILRYRFVAATDPAAGGGREVAAWCEFQHEARKNLRLDELNPALTPGQLDSDAIDAVNVNRGHVVRALDDMDQLLTRRGWKRVHLPETESVLSGRHWYTRRYSRRAIAWDAPVNAQPADEQAVGQSPAKPSGQAGGQP